MLLGLAALFLALGAWQLGGAAWIHAKAALAQILLEKSWRDRLAGEAPRPPWPWADTHPIARLAVPDLQVDLIVLAGSSGRTLAFGPGHLEATATPGGAGHAVISGHRDTHFRFLEDLASDTELRLQTGEGHWRRYRVWTSEVVDSRAAQLTGDAGFSALTLVTCWPFDSRDPGTPWRYVVTLLPTESPRQPPGRVRM